MSAKLAVYGILDYQCPHQPDMCTLIEIAAIFECGMALDYSACQPLVYSYP